MLLLITFSASCHSVCDELMQKCVKTICARARNIIFETVKRVNHLYNTFCNVPNRWRAWRTKKHACTCAITEKHMAVFYSSFMPARCVSSEDDWSLREAFSNATFTAWADLLPFFIFLAFPHFLSFYSPVPLHCLFPRAQYYYTFGSGFVPNTWKCGIISEQ